MLGWLVYEHGIEPHVTVFDKSTRQDGTCSRDDFTYDHAGDVYYCPGGKMLTTTGSRINDGATLRPIATIQGIRPNCSDGPEAAQSELRDCLLSDYAETIAERIAAKRDGRASSAFEFLLTFRAGVQRVDQDNLKIVDMEIDVNWSPVSLISTNVVRPLRRVGFCSFLNQADLGVATFENDVRRDWSSDFDKTQCITIKS